MIGHLPNPLRNAYDQVVIALHIATQSMQPMDADQRSSQLVNTVDALGEARCQAILAKHPDLADQVQDTLRTVVGIIRRGSLDHLGSADAVSAIQTLASAIWSDVAGTAPAGFRSVYSELVIARHIAKTGQLIDAWQRREAILSRAGEHIAQAQELAVHHGIHHLSERVEALLIDLVDRTRKGPDLGEADIECAGHEIDRLIAQVWSTVDQITPKPVLWGKEATR